MRLKIGLPPLNKAAATTEEGKSKSTAIHAPPINAHAENEAKKRIEDAQAKRRGGDLLRKLVE